MDDGDARRPAHRLAIALVAVAGVVVALAWYAWLFATFRAGAPIPIGGGEWVYVYSDAWAYDLDAYVSAASRLKETGSLYDASLVAGPFQPGPRDLFYYAPPLGVAMLPIVDIPVHDSSVPWYVLHIAAFALACALMPVRALIRVFAFVTMSLSSWALKDAVAANVSMLLLLPYVMAWRWMDRPLGSIAIAVAVSVRPSVGVLLLWQLLRRRWRALAWTIGTGLVLILVTLPFVGIDGYRDYFAVVGNLSPPAGPSENRDLGGVLIELGVTGSAVDMARLLGVVIAASVILLSLRRDPRDELHGHPQCFAAAAAAAVEPVPAHAGAAHGLPGAALAADPAAGAAAAVVGCQTSSRRSSAGHVGALFLRSGRGRRRGPTRRRSRRRLPPRPPHRVVSPAMDFGFTLKPEHSIERTIALTRQAEAAGFSYGWLFDSHILWKDVYPLLTLMAVNTETMRLGTCVTNPATRDITVTAWCWPRSTRSRGGRMDLGIGRGDSAQRVLGKGPVKTRTLDNAVRIIKDLVEGRTATYMDTELDLTWTGPDTSCPSGSPATGRWCWA